MSPRRRRSLLEDDELALIDERAAASGSDVCEHCLCERFRHTDDGCECRKCEGFEES